MSRSHFACSAFDCSAKSEVRFGSEARKMLSPTAYGVWFQSTID